LIAGLYKSAITDTTVRRADLVSTDPFFGSMNGADG
jgi:hypothetical protein